MKKKVFLSVLFGLASISVFAQDSEEASKYSVMTNRFGDNWFITGGAGAQVLLGDYDQEGKFLPRIAPAVNFGVGKWFTPGMGLRVVYSGVRAKGSSFGSNGFNYQRFDYMNLHSDVLFNLTNMICGYKSDRIYNAVPYVGFGWAHTYNKQDYFKSAGYESGHVNDFTYNFGLINRFRISKAWDFNLEASATVMKDGFDGEWTNCKADINLAVTAGFTWNIPTRIFNKTKKCPPCTQIISEAELKELRDNLAAQYMRNNDLEEQLKKKPQVVEKEVVKNENVEVMSPHAVFFGLGKSEVSPQELVNLGFCADQMKAHPELKFVLTGYADAATGTPEANKKISEKRANAVIDALVNKYGIDRSRMRAESFGGATKFDKDYLNRTVIISAEK